MVETVAADALSRVTDGVFSMDLRWNYIYLNEAGARLVGKTVDELVGHNMWEVFPEAVGTVFEERYRRSLEQQEIAEFEELFAPLEKWYSIRVYPSPDGLTIYYHETTEQHLAFEKLQRASEEVRKALDGTISSLGYMTETRDPFTAGHQARVGLLAAAMGATLGLDCATLHLLRQSGEVHDIGKIAVPAEILTRPGRLSRLEFEMVKAHTTKGFEILTKASLPWPIAEVARDHHERLDGSGYPSGITAEEISLPARIIAVADVVEAMAHHRPYRPALGIEAALAEVQSGAGTRFDAEVVQSCVAVIADGFDFESLHERRTSDPVDDRRFSDSRHAFATPPSFKRHRPRVRARLRATIEVR